MDRSNLLMIIAIVLVAILSFGCSEDGSGGKDASDAVILVDGESVTAEEVAEEEANLMQQMSGQVSREQLIQMQDGLLRIRAAGNCINRLILEREAVREGIEVSQFEVDDRLAAIIGQFQSEKAFYDQLQNSGMDKEDFMQDLERRIGVEKLFERNASVKAEDVSEEDIRGFYDNNPDKFQQSERISASHILIKVGEADSAEAKLEKRARAEMVLNMVNDGADFAEMARQYSEGPSRDRGGNLGTFGRGQMIKEFEDAAFALKPGEISGIVETSFGYHIIKSAEYFEPRVLQYEAVKENIRSYLVSLYKQRKIVEYIDKLRSESNIEYIDSTLVESGS